MDSGEAGTVPGADGRSATFDFDNLDLAALREKRGTKWRQAGEGALSAWVADMDFPIAPVIRAAIDAALDRGDLGYPDWVDPPLGPAFAKRMADHHGWILDAGAVRGITDVVQGVERTLGLVTDRDAVVMTVVPNYPPFLHVAGDLGRRLVTFTLDHDGEVWRFDADALRAEVRASGSRVLLFVNPHNPTGHVFTRAELEVIAEIACDEDLTVISDEIHSDLTYDPFVHTPLASLGEEIARRTVTLTSATKAFNIAGLRCALAHVGPPELLERWDAEPRSLFGTTNALGVEATLAAWRDGGPWLAALRAHLARQRARCIEWAAATDGVALIAPEATYLAWLDFRGAALGVDAASFFREHAHVELLPGERFGTPYRAWARLNFATSSGILDQMLDAMAAALSER
jgi:bifunctional pyridoxal-dependent enzyme with beta-cystathionase and maltose regulon repressor activities